MLVTFLSSIVTSWALGAALWLLDDGAYAYPTGAGGCSGVNGSVGDLHLMGPIFQTGPLATTKLAVAITDGDVAVQDTQAAAEALTPLTDGGSATITVGEPYTIQLYAPGGEDEFEGFLFRLAPKAGSTADTSAYLIPSDTETNSQLADVCLALNLGGVTHKSKLEVAMVTTQIMVDEPMELELQVTAVAHNGFLPNGTHRSIFYHDTYQISAVQGGANDGDGNDGGGAHTPTSGQGGAPAPTKTAPIPAPAPPAEATSGSVGPMTGSAVTAVRMVGSLVAAALLTVLGG